jgi:hypothetical protein
MISLKNDYSRFSTQQKCIEKYGNVTNENVDDLVTCYQSIKNDYFFNLKAQFSNETEYSLSEEELNVPTGYITLFTDDFDGTISSIDVEILNLSNSQLVDKIIVLPLGGGLPFTELDDGGGGVSNNFGDIETAINLNYWNSLNCDSTDYKYSGCGVNVGIFESRVQEQTSHGYVDPLSSFFTNSNPFLPAGVNESNFSDHPRIVAGISSGYYGLAPNSKVFSNHFIGDPGLSGLSWYFSSEFNLLNQGAINIINMSYGPYDISNYNYWIETYNKFAYNNNSTVFIASAGNKTNHEVVTPSAAHNIFSVGGTTDDGNELWVSDNDLGSSYLEYNNVEKPNIVAPAVINIVDPDNGNELYSNYGTSFAAPLVTGATALLLEKEPALKVQPELVYALLLASANNDNYTASSIQSFNQSFGEKTGAGILNVDALLTNSSNTWYPSVSSNTTSLSHSFNVITSSTKTLKVAMFWMKKYEGNDGYLSNYDINVYHNNVLIGDSDLVYNNSELVITNFSSSGTIRIEIITTNFEGNDSQNIGVAWVIE